MHFTKVHSLVYCALLALPLRKICQELICGLLEIQYRLPERSIVENRRGLRRNHLFMSTVECRKAHVRIALIQLYGDLQPANAEPLSIEALAGAIQTSLPETKPDLFTISSSESCEKQRAALTKILQQQYQLIGLSCPQGTFGLAIQVLEALSTPADGPQIVLGHALPTYLPDLFLEHFPKVFIIRGWGEPGFLGLCRHLARGDVQLEHIPSLTYLDAQGTRHDTPVEWAYEAVIPRRINPARYFVRVEASRGCHYNVCTFCSRPPLQKGQSPWKRFEICKVIEQVQRLVKAGITTFTFTDEDFVGDDPQGALDLATRLCEIPGLDFALSVRADNIHHPQASAAENALRLKVFQTLRQAGLTLVFIGAESFSPSQLRRYGKGSTPNDTIQAIRLLETLSSEQGQPLELELGLILFDPLLQIEELYETVSSLQSTRFWKYVGQLFSFMRVQVGTPYARLLEKQGMLGPISVNSIEYKAAYADPRVASLAEICHVWGEEFNRLYVALRNVARSELGAGRFTDFVVRYRSMQVELLLHLVSRAMAGTVDRSIDDELQGWRRQVYLFIDELLTYIHTLETLSPSEKLLLQTVMKEKDRHHLRRDLVHG